MRVSSGNEVRVVEVDDLAERCRGWRRVAGPDQVQDAQPELACPSEFLLYPCTAQHLRGMKEHHDFGVQHSIPECFLEGPAVLDAECVEEDAVVAFLQGVKQLCSSGVRLDPLIADERCPASPNQPEFFK